MGMRPVGHTILVSRFNNGNLLNIRLYDVPFYSKSEIILIKFVNMDDFFILISQTNTCQMKYTRQQDFYLLVLLNYISELTKECP